MINIPKSLPKEIILKERLLTELSIIYPSEEWKEYLHLTCDELEVIKGYLLKGYSIESIKLLFIKR
jgi:hypothetical protein